MSASPLTQESTTPELHSRSPGDNRDDDDVESATAAALAQPQASKVGEPDDMTQLINDLGMMLTSPDSGATSAGQAGGATESDSVKEGKLEGQYEAAEEAESEERGRELEKPDNDVQEFGEREPNHEGPSQNVQELEQSFEGTHDVQELEQAFEEPDYDMPEPEQAFEEPDYEVQEPEQAFDVPDHNVQEPEQALEKPNHDVQELEQAIEEPDHVVQVPEQAFEEPDHNVQEPQQAFEEPDRDVQEPEQAFGEPNHDVQEPEQAFEEPDHEVQNPEHAFEVPDHDVQEPEQAFEEPNHDVKEPEQAFEEPDHEVQETEHAFEVPDHNVHDPEHASEEPDHDLQKPEQAFEEPDHDVQVQEHAVERPDNDVQEPEQSFEEPNHDVQEPVEEQAPELQAESVSELQDQLREGQVPVTEQSRPELQDQVATIEPLQTVRVVDQSMAEPQEEVSIVEHARPEPQEPVPTIEPSRSERQEQVFESLERAHEVDSERTIDATEAVQGATQSSSVKAPTQEPSAQQNGFDAAASSPPEKEDQEESPPQDEFIDILGTGQLLKKTLTRGGGPDTRPKADCRVTVNYEARLGGEAGTVVDRQDGLTLTIGDCGLVQALDIGLMLTELGEHCLLVSGPQFSYGSRRPHTTQLGCHIQPDSTLTYAVTLTHVADPLDLSSLGLTDRLGLADAKRERGNFWFNREDHHTAVCCYARAATMLEQHCSGDMSGAADATVQGVLDARVRVYNNLAACQLKLEAWDSVAESCDKALALQPSNAKALYRKGRALSYRGDHAGALRVLRAALRDDPDSKALQNEVARVTLESRRQQTASQELYRRMMGVGGGSPGSVQSRLSGSPDASTSASGEAAAAAASSSSSTSTSFVGRNKYWLAGALGTVLASAILAAAVYRSNR